MFDNLNLISIVELTNGELIGLGTLEILTVPHISVLQKRINTITNIHNDYKKDMEHLLSEVYQNYSNAANHCQDISLELLWSTKEVDNQPYKASISLHIIIRVIGNNNADIEHTITSILRLCKSTLDFGKYEYRDSSFGELFTLVSNISAQSIKAVVKNEHLEDLQNNILSHCFTFDRLPDTDNDLSRIVSSLIEYPNCAISFQLIPVTYTPEEADAVDRNAQILDTLSKGVVEQGVGNISITLAEKHAETYKYYSRHKNTSKFAFNIIVYGESSAANAISTRVLTQLNNSSELRIITLPSDNVCKDQNIYPLPWALHEIVLSTDRNQAIWNTEQNANSLYSLPYIITSEEASEFFRLPIGSEKVYAGLAVNESGKVSRTYADDVIGGSDIDVGALKSATHNDNIGISLKDINKHMLIVGTPGSGKTTFSIGLLDRLWKDHQIPFLVIEPAKNEYRAMVQSIPDLQVFTPGKSFISPFVFNPFALPKNVKLETYKSTLKTAFAAAVSMSTPLDKIFEEAVNNCYSDFRWFDTYTSEDKGQTFNISDFIKCFEQTFEAIGYTGDAKNIGRAGLVRLQSLVNLFDNYHSIPIEDLLTKPTIIELGAIENNDQKALIISLLLLSILAYVNSNYIGEGNLRNVILLEEAHVLLDANTTTEQGEANPSAIAQGLVKRMLAEIRAYGVGIIIADQSPRKVTTDVVALTDIKLAFRLVEANDKQILADSSNMTETQKERLAKLKPGEAFLFYGRLDEPEEIITEDYRRINNISISLSDNKIKSMATYWNERKDKLRPYPECKYCQYCISGCDYNTRIIGREVAKRIFAKNFNKYSADSEIIKSIFKKMSIIIKQELNDETYDQKLFACVEIHFMRRIKNGTKIKISDATVRKTISKI